MNSSFHVHNQRLTDTPYQYLYTSKKLKGAHPKSWEAPPLGTKDDGKKKKKHKNITNIIIQLTVGVLDMQFAVTYPSAHNTPCLISNLSNMLKQNPAIKYTGKVTSRIECNYKS